MLSKNVSTYHFSNAARVAENPGTPFVSLWSEIFKNDATTVSSITSFRMKSVFYLNSLQTLRSLWSCWTVERTLLLTERKRQVMEVEARTAHLPGLKCL